MVVGESDAAQRYHRRALSAKGDITQLQIRRLPGHWPVTTFAINFIGAFVLGGLLEALARLGPDSGWRQRVRVGIGTGVIGSFTTYSTLSVDTDLLLRGHHPWSAITYALGTVIVGMVATAVGIATGTWMASRRGEEQN
ncbi:fluoride efflux transporter FluC [Nocardia salmonicida]|uniref:fluoride efflux transporter FluC n=1 Tax=Nocardia salmonicida TaxID=53431 RepID=UPI0033FE0B97